MVEKFKRLYTMPQVSILTSKRSLIGFFFNASNWSRQKAVGLIPSSQQRPRLKI